MSKRRTGSRRLAREFALQALYRAEVVESEGEQDLSGLWSTVLDDEGLPETPPPDAEQVAFAERLVRGVEHDHEAIDALIEACSTNWRIRRMPLVDRNILRIAAYELMTCHDIPASVTCNEAVELAKRFGGMESRAFVNGLVDRMGRQLGRLASPSGEG